MKTIAIKDLDSSTINIDDYLKWQLSTCIAELKTLEYSDHDILALCITRLTEGGLNK